MSYQIAPLPLTEGKLLMDNSNLQITCECPRKAYQKLILRRQKVKPRMALFFGGAIHKALEVRDRFQQSMCTLEIERLMIDALIKEYDEVDVESDYRNLDYAIHTIEKYNTAWKYDNEIAITLPDGKVAVELPFAIKVGEVSLKNPLLCCDNLDLSKPPWYQSKFELIFTGKIDRICDYQGYDNILDHKTTSIGGPTFFDEFYTSLQFRGYKYAAQAILGRPISGVLINAIMARPPKKGGDVNYTFERQHIPIDNSLVDEWKNSFVTLSKQWLTTIATYQLSESEQAFPLHTSSCNAKYGQCEYFDVCQLPVAHRRMMLDTPLFEDHFWSPLEDGAKPKKKPEANLEGLFD